jgi:hypothetical protein
MATPKTSERTPQAIYRDGLRRKLTNLFLDEYKLRKERGELLYSGSWITPDNKFEFIEEMKKEHKHLLHDSVLALFSGFVIAFAAVLLIRFILFPN